MVARVRLVRGRQRSPDTVRQTRRVGVRQTAAVRQNEKMSPTEIPTKSVTIRVPTALLARIDADWKRQKKASRTEWLVGLAAAVLDGRLVPKR
jgi:hypothetical protein